MKKVVILHVFTDDKFFDSVSSFFDSLKNVENVYVFTKKQSFFCNRLVDKT